MTTTVTASCGHNKIQADGTGIIHVHDNRSLDLFEIFARIAPIIQTTKVLNGIACGLKSAARCLAEVTGASLEFQSLSMKIGND